MKRKGICLLLTLMLFFCFVSPVSADTAFFTDETGRPSPEELYSLNDEAERIAEEYFCGVYGYIVGDYETYNSESVYEAAKTIYQINDLGVGEDHDGVLLLLSMEERDYALIAYGDFANGTFTDAGKDYMADVFLSSFGNDDWYGGFLDYLEVSEEMVAAEISGTSADVYEGSDDGSVIVSVLIILLVPCGIALLICLLLRRGMKTARKKYTAEEYISGEKVEVTVREDHFSHMTQVRTPIPKSDGTSIDIGGFSGKSGKF
ncbi:MAG: TPM domain-containing protein [Clostridia bacterium]